MREMEEDIGGEVVALGYYFPSFAPWNVCVDLCAFFARYFQFLS